MNNWGLINVHPSLFMLGIELNMKNIAIITAMGMQNEEIYQKYKKKIQDEMQKERKRVHNKKKSDRMKRLRVKKEKKRA